MKSAETFDTHLEKYLKPLKNGKKFNLKHLFFAENPLDAKYVDTMLNYFYNPVGNRTNYFTAVYVGLGIENAGSNKSEQLEAMKKAGVLVWDIFHHKGIHKKSNIPCDKCNAIHAGEKISSDKRNDMIQEGCSLHAFQSSVEALIKLDIEVDKNLNIYFMMPQLTSLPIFNFYNKNKNEELEIKGIEVSKMMRKGNPLVPDEEYEQEIFPRHMINVIGGSNTPRANLVKHARNCQGVMHKMKPNQK